MAQESQIEIASENFEEFDYIEAIKEYEDLVKQGYNNAQIYKQLGDANFYNSNYRDAAKWYRGYYLSSNKKMESEYLFRYALSLKSLKRYEESDEVMLVMKDSLPDDLRVQKFTSKANYIKEIERSSNRGNVFKLSFNSSVSDFAPSFYKDKLVFSSARPTDKKKKKSVHGWNQMPFLNIYSTYTTQENTLGVMPFSQELNSKAHESSTVFTKDGKTIYFTRNNFKEGDFVRDSEGISRLKIFRSFYLNGFWSTPEELPFSSNEYSVAHPSLNTDETRLYFASDMPGSLGNSDIFYVDILEDGSFGEPVNLGPAINTEARETFPFVSASDVLYFASDGHPGLGGLDIFAAKKLEDESIKVLNVGKPMNSEMDDFGLIINEEQQNGYLTSNRDGGRGSDDIYGFRETKSLDFSCITKISGRVINRNNGKKIEQVTIQITGLNDNIIDEITTDDDGNFAFELDCTETFVKVIGKKIEYRDEVVELQLEGIPELNDLLVEMKPEPNAVPMGTELGEFLGIQRLKFDFGKTFIRPDAAIQLNKLYIYLRDFPQINIEIRQYTDSRGSESTNAVLSRRRAKSIKDYLIATGIDKNRIEVQGLGESNLANHCANGVRCSEKEHQQNNRSEFIVIN